MPRSAEAVAAIGDGWKAVSTPPSAWRDPSDLDPGAGWLPATVPGTAAGALAAAGLWRAGEASALDESDWWFRTRFDAGPAAAGEEVVLRLDGIATVADVFLNGEPVLSSRSMFVAHAVDVSTRLREGGNEIAICCRALTPLLGGRRMPRARWRTQLVEGNLRWFRTMLLGRAPGFAPGPAAVGPWRSVRLERRRGLVLEDVLLRPRLEYGTGVLEVRATARTPSGPEPGSLSLELDGPSGAHECALRVEDGVAAGQLAVPGVAPWWPHTHGAPALHDVRIAAPDGETVATARVGFRSLTAGGDLERDGLDLHVNGVRVFARGAVWTPADFVTLAPSADELRAALVAVRDAGMNMVRIPGTACYESDAFFDLCDELGVLVWQDFMFANLDYPIADDEFRLVVEREARGVLAAIAGRPSLAVLCGNSEVEQQVAMLGLDPALGRGELFGELLPAWAREAKADVPYVPSAPCGDGLPFRPDRGIANYYGVGGYRRDLGDVRRSSVRFAAECLAFANVPEDELLEAVGNPRVHEPAWKAGVPRDAGSGWDFDDVRDHYLAAAFGVDPAELRRVDHERYLDLSRFVSGELMAEVFGEWRRAGSPCGGGLVLWLRDLVPGAGWGIVDSTGVQKVPFHYLRRALASIAVWTTDEGLGGIDVHLANDRPESLTARLRVALYRDLERPVERVEERVTLAGHSLARRNVEELLGRFVDASWAYRFGPRGHDLLVATLEPEPRDDAVPIAQAFRLVGVGFPAREPTERLGLEARAEPRAGGTLQLAVRSRRLAYGVRVRVGGFVPSDDAFCVEPGGERIVHLHPTALDTRFAGGTVTALNLAGAVPVSSVSTSAS